MTGALWWPLRRGVHAAQTAAVAKFIARPRRGEFVPGRSVLGCLQGVVRPVKKRCAANGQLKDRCLENECGELVKDCYGHGH